MKAKKSSPPTFLRIDEVAERWRRHPRVARRLLKHFGIAPVRLTGHSNLFRFSDIRALEEASLYRKPQPGNPNWKKKEVANDE